MSNIFDLTARPDAALFFSANDKNDPRLGEFVHSDERHYAAADLVILGFPQDEGVRRRDGRVGAAEAPDKIREQFYRLTTFNIRKKIFDLGNTKTDGSLEDAHANHTAVVAQLLRDGKRVIVLGGGGDVSYPDGVAMAEVFGPEWWIGINIDSHLDVRLAPERNSGTAFRQLIEEKHLLPTYFYEAGYQSHLTSPTYYDYIRTLGIHRISLELLRSRSEADLELKDQIRQKFIGHSSSLNTFFGFDLSVVRTADAPGTSSPSPLGLRAGELIQLVKYAASLANTKIIEFTEVNPRFDVDDRTTKLVAIAMHRFCTGVA
ncbi:MAG: formimidoylglutamase [Pyrinomonadaceae bacterium]|nr:formimidoylglutamase [Pyrinomonadaceae bacterium]